MKKIHLIFAIFSLCLFSCATTSNTESPAAAKLSPSYEITSGSISFLGYGNNSNSATENTKNFAASFIQEHIKAAMIKYIVENGLDEQDELYDFTEQLSYLAAKKAYSKLTVQPSEQIKKDNWQSKINILKTDIIQSIKTVLNENSSFEASAFSEFDTESLFNAE